MGIHPFVLIAEITLGMAVVAWLLARRQRRRLERLHQSLEHLPGIGPGQDRDLTWGRHRATVHYQAGGRNEPSRLTLSCQVPGTGAFELTPLTWLDRLVERMGLARRIPSGDPRFDARCSLASDQPDFAAACFAESGPRAAAEALFGQGCARVHLEAGALKAVWTPFAVDRDVAFLPACVGHLGVLAEGLPPAPLPGPASGLTRARFKLLLTGAWIAVAAAAAALVLTHAVPGPMDKVRLFLDTLRFSLPAAGLVLVLAGRALRAKAWGAGPLGHLALLVLLACTGAGYALAAAANTRLDRAPAAEHRTAVVDKRSRGGRHPSRTAILRSWRPGRDLERVMVTASEYQRLVPGRTVATVVTHPGRLGYEWLEDIRFEP